MLIRRLQGEGEGLHGGCMRDLLARAQSDEERVSARAFGQSVEGPHASVRGGTAFLSGHIPSYERTRRAAVAQEVAETSAAQVRSYPCERPAARPQLLPQCGHAVVGAERSLTAGVLPILDELFKPRLVPPARWDEASGVRRGS